MSSSPTRTSWIIEASWLLKSWRIFSSSSRRASASLCLVCSSSIMSLASLSSVSLVLFIFSARIAILSRAVASSPVRARLATVSSFSLKSLRNTSVTFLLLKIKAI